MANLNLYTRRDPFLAEFDSLVRGVLAPSAPAAAARRLDFTPAAEATRDGDDAVLRLDLPGMAPEDVTVELLAGRLHVKGERRDERAESAGGRSIREIRYGSFERSFAVPAHVTADAVRADYDAGVLTVRVTGVYAGTEPARITVGTGPVPADPAPEAADRDPEVTAGE